MFKVKEYKEENPDEGKLIWTTEKVDQLNKAIEDGYQPADHPFYEGDLHYKKGNLVFEYTDSEVDEIKKCARDIVYFANTYCTVMTDEGYMKITLRPYQERVLKSYQNNRWNIFMAARQIGKCHVYNTKVWIRNRKTKDKQEISIGDLYYQNNSPTFIEKIKIFLYKILQKLEK